MLSSPKLVWEGIGAFHYYHHHPAHETPERYHTHHVLHLHLNGAKGVEFRLDKCDRFKIIENGNIFITPANAIHSANLLDENSEFILLDIDPKFIGDSIREFIQPDSFEIVPNVVQFDPLIYQIGLALKVELTADALGSRFYAESLFTALSAQLLRKHSSHRLKTPRYIEGSTFLVL